MSQHQNASRRRKMHPLQGEVSPLDAPHCHIKSNNKTHAPPSNQTFHFEKLWDFLYKE